MRSFYVDASRRSCKACREDFDVENLVEALLSTFKNGNSCIGVGVRCV